MEALADVKPNRGPNPVAWPNQLPRCDGSLDTARRVERQAHGDLPVQHAQANQAPGRTPNEAQTTRTGTDWLTRTIAERHSVVID